MKVQLPGSGNENLVMATLTSLWDKPETQSKRTAEVLCIEDSPNQKRTCPHDRGVGPASKGRQALANTVCTLLERLRGPPGQVLSAHRRETFVTLLDAAVLDVLDEDLPSKDLDTVREVVADASAALELV